MSILSLNFVVFTLATVIVYYLVPLKCRWCILLLASVVFYALSGWQGCIWVLLVAAIAYGSSVLQHKLLLREKKTAQTEEQRQKLQEQNQHQSLEESSDGMSLWEISSDEGMDLPSSGWFSSSKKIKHLRKLVLAISIIVPFLGMAFVKYYEILPGIWKELPQLSLIVPLGLSYFTFQSVGYMIDIYRGKFAPEQNPLKLLLFVSFFPQMTQGPISTFPQLMPQLLEGHPFDPDNFVMGAQLALWGFFKKMVIADAFSTVASSITISQPGWFILLTTIIYLMRLYADFSGGMDVIRGAARMLGVDMIENFRRPFFSLSVAEYWRRWHISLGNWFRNYLFYSFTTSGCGLALSKIGKKIFGKKAGRALPAAVSTVIIFFLIGIWHKANWNALIYGLYFGLIMGAATLLDPSFKKLKKKLHINEKKTYWKAFCMLRTWILVLLPQYFAYTKGPEKGFGLLVHTFQNWDFSQAAVQFTNLMDPIYWYGAAGGVLLLLIIDIICEKVPTLNEKIAKGPFYIRWPLLILLILAILTFGCYGTGYDGAAFLYTNF